MLIGLAGLSGSGKSTAIDLLVKKGVGLKHYAGCALNSEIRARGLEATPEVERRVREEMRQQYGMAVFAERSIDELRSKIAFGWVMIDAVYCPEERECYRAAFGDQLAVISLSASLDTRTARLAVRPERPMSSSQLLERDRLEEGRFNLRKVIEEATVRLPNDGTLSELEAALELAVAQLRFM